MVFEIGVNLRVTECLDKGDRNYMEDFSKCYFERVDGSIVFGFFGIFDGHGGSEAASFAKKHLVNEIKKINEFWSENDDEVLAAIKHGFFNTHQSMWSERDKWAKTVSGFDSTAGTTATIAIVRNRKLYIGHVGDSACVLGFSKLSSARTDLWEPSLLTIDHKPGNINERKRIEKVGGSLAKKSGVQRVVWNRPKLSLSHSNHLNTPNNSGSTIAQVEGDSIEYEQVPFLAVTRSLGDLWSYDQFQGVYHISPEPDVQCISLDSLEHRCIILGSDGLWNVVPVRAAVEIIRICERETERRVFLDPNINSNFFYNPAASLVKYAISQWKRKQVRADNVSALVVMIDPPGPSMTKRREDRRKANFSSMDILNSLTCKNISYESFAKIFSKEFLIECNRWRSANDSKDEVADNQRNSKKDISNAEMNPPSNSIVSRKSSDKSSFVNQNISQNSFSTALQSSSSSKRCQNLATHHLLSSDPFYSKFCLGWANNSKIWTFISEYFKSLSLNSETEILKYLNSIDPSISTEILKIMPWIYSSKITFRKQPMLHNALNKVPIFSDIWLELQSKYINPLEKTCSTISFNSMETILGILRQNILSLLKQYNYISSVNITDRSGNSKLDEINENNEINRPISNSTKAKSTSNFQSLKKSKKRFSSKPISDSSNCDRSRNPSNNSISQKNFSSSSIRKASSHQNYRLAQSECKHRSTIQNASKKSNNNLHRATSDKLNETSKELSKKIHNINSQLYNNGSGIKRVSQNSSSHINNGDIDITNRLNEINGNYRRQRRGSSSNSNPIPALLNSNQNGGLNNPCFNNVASSTTNESNSINHATFNSSPQQIQHNPNNNNNTHRSNAHLASSSNQNNNLEPIRTANNIAPIKVLFNNIFQNTVTHQNTNESVKAKKQHNKLLKYIIKRTLSSYRE